MRSREAIPKEPGWIGLLYRRMCAAPIRVKSLETPLTYHCNLRCAACDHGSPLLAKSFLEPEQLAHDLRALKSAMRAQEFRLVGGEPLQHPDLLRIIGVVRESAIARRIVLVTNGVLLHKAPPALWRSIDRLWLSIYPGVSLGLTLEEIESRCREHRVAFQPRPTKQFRFVLLNQAIEDDDLVRWIYDDCKTAHVWRCYTVLNGRFYKCSKSSVMLQRLEQLGIPHDPDAADGIDLHSGRGLMARLQAYLESKAPLAACRFCLGTSGPLVRHHQLNARGVQAALREDHAALIQEMREMLRRRKQRAEESGRRPPVPA